MKNQFFKNLTSYTTCACFIFGSLLSSCGSRSLEDYREEAEEVTHSLIIQLDQIHTRDQLLARSAKLKRLFNDLVSVIIASQEYRQKQFARGVPPLSENNHLLSDQLYEELNRIYAIDGCRAIIEKCQEEALNRLDAFEKQAKRSATF